MWWGEALWNSITSYLNGAAAVAWRSVPTSFAAAVASLPQVAFVYWLVGACAALFALLLALAAESEEVSALTTEAAAAVAREAVAASTTAGGEQKQHPRTKRQRGGAPQRCCGCSSCGASMLAALARWATPFIAYGRALDDPSSAVSAKGQQPRSPASTNLTMPLAVATATCLPSVPKAWFAAFYAVSLLSTSAALAVALAAHFKSHHVHFQVAYREEEEVGGGAAVGGDVLGREGVSAFFATVLDALRFYAASALYSPSKSGVGTSALLALLARLAPLLLFLLHSARRLFECLCVQRFDPRSRMPLHLWLAGVGHYILAPASLAPPALPPARGAAAMAPAAMALLGVGVATFLVGNGVQMAAHWQLARMRHRREDEEVGERALPSGTATKVQPTPAPASVSCCCSRGALLGNGADTLTKGASYSARKAPPPRGRSATRREGCTNIKAKKEVQTEGVSPGGELQQHSRQEDGDGANVGSGTRDNVERHSVAAIAAPASSSKTAALLFAALASRERALAHSLRVRAAAGAAVSSAAPKNIASKISSSSRAAPVARGRGLASAESPGVERLMPPTSGLFAYSWSPHYAAEVAIYGGLALVAAATWSAEGGSTEDAAASSGSAILGLFRSASGGFHAVATSWQAGRGLEGLLASLVLALTVALELTQTVGAHVFAALAQLPPSAMLTLWVAVNLSATAVRSRLWYAQAARAAGAPLEECWAMIVKPAMLPLLC